NRTESAGDFVWRDHFAVYADAFAISDEMRRGKKTGPITGGAANRIDHRANGAFAVGAGDVNNALIFPGNVQLAEQALDILKPELDSEALRSVKPGQRFLEISRGSRHKGSSHAHCVV